MGNNVEVVLSLPENMDDVRVELNKKRESLESAECQYFALIVKKYLDENPDISRVIFWVDSERGYSGVIEKSVTFIGEDAEGEEVDNTVDLLCGYITSAVINRLEMFDGSLGVSRDNFLVFLRTMYGAEAYTGYENAGLGMDGVNKTKKFGC